MLSSCWREVASRGYLGGAGAGAVGCADARQGASRLAVARLAHPARRPAPPIGLGWVRDGRLGRCCTLTLALRVAKAVGAATWGARRHELAARQVIVPLAGAVKQDALIVLAWQDKGGQVGCHRKRG